MDFRTGDIVEVFKPFDAATVGVRGTVIGPGQTKEWVLVQLMPEYRRIGHSCHGQCPKSDGYYFLKSIINLVDLSCDAEVDVMEFL